MTRELGVNLAGVVIILNMREKMGAMQRQIEEFVARLNLELASQPLTPDKESHNMLIPVIEAKRLKKN